MRRARSCATVLLAVLLATACGGCGGGGAEPVAAGSPSSEGTTGPSAAEEPSRPDATSSGQIDPSLAGEAQSLAAAAQSQAGQLSTGPSIAPRTGPVLGADISWPQCPPGLGIAHKISSGQPLPRPDAEYVVLGLTNGPGFHANPCLADQVAYARQRGLLVSAYSVISQPDAAQVAEHGGLKGAGYAQATFNVASMKAAGLTSPIVWLDVEPVPFYDWGTDTAANAQVVQGAAEGYLDAGYTVGVYSTPYLWAGVVGDLTLGVPEWRAAGQTSYAEALSRCGPDWSIQGGEAVIGQWVEDSRDRNVTCPGESAHLGLYFTRL